jgi:hypothetical protein
MQLVGAVREPLLLQGFQFSRNIMFIFDVKLLYNLAREASRKSLVAISSVLIFNGMAG